MFNILITENNASLKSQIFEITDAYANDSNISSPSHATLSGSTVSNFTEVRVYH